MELKGLKANFLGDSITAGVGTSSPEHIFLNVIKTECGLAEARNYGISGTRIARQTECAAAGNNDDCNYCARVAEMDPDADLIVVFGGTNDFGHGNAPFGEETDRTRDTFIGACHELFSSLLNKYPAATIVVMTPTHRWNEDASYGDWRTNQPMILSEYVKVIKDVAAKYSLPVFDAYAMGGIQPLIPGQKEIYMPDGLHPSDAGNARIAQRLIGFLRTL